MPLAFSEACQINWLAPWLAHLAPRFPTHTPEQWANAPDLKIALNAAVDELRAQGLPMLTGQGQALHFIAQADLPEGVAYEAHIAQTSGVPTRLNLHDFFNASIWLTFPLTKAVLNARQFEHIATHGVTHQRGMARDALTLFDENASDHLALGAAYPFSVAGGTAMTDDQLRAAGLNRSLVHVDFMVGSDDLNIWGVDADGAETPVFVGGQWAWEE